MRMNRLTVGKRLGLGFGLATLLTLLVSLVAAFGLARGERALATVYADRTVPLDQLGQVQHLMMNSHLDLIEALDDPASARTRIGAYKQHQETIEKVWAAYMATYLTEDEVRLAAAAEQTRRVLTQEGYARMAEALGRADAAAARQAYVRVQQLSPAFRDAMRQLVELQVRVAREEFDAAVAFADRINVLMALAVSIALAVGTATAFTLRRSLWRALGAEPQDLASVAQRVASGDLRAEASPPAVAGSVMEAMQRMRQSLEGLVTGVRASVDSVATASAQIAQGNLDLSGRTERQAADLQQTAATMEQLTGTVRSGADHAGQADALARQASAAATRGGTVVGQVVDTMARIQTSSQRIAEITGVIDGIAFQTNILALNAAVEAARAGEQGRGFAVVAAEVRTLAQRSAEAARQIKLLITESVETVQTGHTLVQEAGQTMHGVVEQVQRVSTLIGQISAAAQEQTQGIGQVGHAMAQLDQATQQNAALVEESAAAASSLNDQARRLAEAVAAFRLQAAQG